MHCDSSMSTQFTLTRSSANNFLFSYWWSVFPRHLKNLIIIYWSAMVILSKIRWKDDSWFLAKYMILRAWEILIICMLWLFSEWFLKSTRYMLHFHASLAHLGHIVSLPYFHFCIFHIFLFITFSLKLMWNLCHQLGS